MHAYTSMDHFAGCVILTLDEMEPFSANAKWVLLGLCRINYSNVELTRAIQHCELIISEYAVIQSG